MTLGLGSDVVLRASDPMPDPLTCGISEHWAQLTRGLQPAGCRHYRPLAAYPVTTSGRTVTGLSLDGRAVTMWRDTSRDTAYLRLTWGSHG